MGFMDSRSLSNQQADTQINLRCSILVLGSTASCMRTDPATYSTDDKLPPVASGLKPSHLANLVGFPAPLLQPHAIPQGLCETL